jgi:hypothetical protein
VHDDSPDAGGGQVVADLAPDGRVGDDGVPTFDGDEVEPAGAGVDDELGEAGALQGGPGAEVGVGGDVARPVSGQERGDDGDLGVEACLGANGGVFPGGTELASDGP